MHQQAELILRNNGLRCTPGRVRILGVLLEADEPLSNARIINRLGGRAVDKVTVYRVMEAFMLAGLVHRAYLRDRTWHFEFADRCGPRQCHPHFTCRKCGRTTCLTDASVPLASHLPKGFTMERQRVHLTGLCNKCSKGENV